jgi:inner membrane transporter RhtA
LVFLPIGLAVVVRHPPSPGVVGYAIAASVLSSAVPFLADLFTLCRVPTQASVVCRNRDRRRSRA